MTRRSAPLVLGVLWWGSLACASSGDPGVRLDPTWISSDELRADAVAPLSAYDAVQRLRPGWLAPRPPTSLNSSAGTLPGALINNTVDRDVNQLRTIRVAGVESMRLIDGRDATTRFGTGFGNGLIEVTFIVGPR